VCADDGGEITNETHRDTHINLHNIETRGSRVCEGRHANFHKFIWSARGEFVHTDTHAKYTEYMYSPPGTDSPRKPKIYNSINN